jgi:hypothetical protein
MSTEGMSAFYRLRTRNLFQFWRTSTAGERESCVCVNIVGVVQKMLFAVLCEVKCVVEDNVEWAENYFKFF